MKPPTSRDPQGPKDKGPQLLTDRIRATEVRLISDEQQYGVVSRKEAEALARETGLDLIVMSLDSSPPVVRLMDYGKYKYEKDRKDREARKKQHVIDVKEVKMGVRIDKHDFEIKAKHAQEFLSHGDKVKCSIRLRGREIQHADLAMELANRFITFLAESGTPETFPKMEGRTITLVLAPLKKKN
jgi:translation initiation factor IF-3